ncbi:phosphatidate cytidylyltransferase, mitochondrial-like [Halichondria panicea]|uniref:phosphatidate cytidylyltransferase, mitochondrial-like n=1 Tax=Halichondria panicea TaxID=6063 RepID=UPI00312B2EBE
MMNSNTVKTFYQLTLKNIFPPITYAFAYGSAVVQQHGRPKGKMLDLVFAVDDPREWHKSNLQRNGHHYSFLRHLGLDTVVRLQQLSAGVYYNTLVTVDTQLLKYGVISTDDLLNDLLNWKWLYISGRLHKPVLYLTKEYHSPILNALKDNHRSAAICGVLLQDRAEFTEEQLFSKITELSYNGDFRQLVGEDRHKINNIVAASHSEFSRLYRPYLDDLVDYSSGKLIKRPDVLKSQLQVLPLTVREHLENGMKLDEALKAIVRASSIKQSSKGVITAGLKKTAKYSFSKLQKMIKSYR